MKAVLVMTPKGLHGSTSSDQEAWAKLKRRMKTMKPGDWLRFEWQRPRNGKHHRKFMALLQLIAENSETYDTVEKALVAVKLIVGHFEPAVHPLTGEVVPAPKSINYESMDQDAFEKFYNQAIDGILAHILTQMDRETADGLVDMIVAEWGG